MRIGRFTSKIIGGCAAAALVSGAALAVAANFADGSSPAQASAPGAAEEGARSVSMTCQLESGREFRFSFSRAENVARFDGGPKVPIEGVIMDGDHLVAIGRSESLDIVARFGSRPSLTMVEAGGRQTLNPCHRVELPRGKN